MNHPTELSRRALLGSLAATTTGTLDMTLGSAASEIRPAGNEVVQAQKVLTVSEGKMLIAKGIVRAPMVRDVLKKGMLIIAKGTTTTYIAKEILQTDIPHGAFVIGRVYPEKGGRRLRPGEMMDEIILVDGQWQKGLSLQDAVKRLKIGDVVLKGANVLNHSQKLAAGLIGNPSATAGTTGTILPPIFGTKAQLIVPVSLEKEVSGDMIELVRAMQAPIPPIGNDYSLALYTGLVFTEIEALQTLTGVSALHVSSGGIGGAEGAVRLLLRGSRQQVEDALEIIESIQGEPPFVH